MERAPSRKECRHVVSGKILPVLQWWEASGEQSPKVPPRAGWRWFERQAAREKWQATSASLDERYPGKPDVSLEFEGLRFTRLRSRSSLFRAGHVFRNCLVSTPCEYDHIVKNGSHFAIYDANTDRPKALFHAVMNDRGRPIRVLELRGPCNQPVSQDLQLVVQRFLGWLALRTSYCQTAHPLARSRSANATSSVTDSS
jgi:hypothetical protein